MLEVENQVMTVGGKNDAGIVVVVPSAGIVQAASLYCIRPLLRAVVEFPNIDAHFLAIPADHGSVR